MYLVADAIVLSVRAHGEHGAVVRGFTQEGGVWPGYVRGGHSRRLRPILQPTNLVRGEWRARTDEQLPALTVELGFGLDLSACVATGAVDDLAFVSPKSGGAVSRAAAVGYEARLLRLPAFLAAGGEAGWVEVMDALAITGHFIERDVLVDRRREALSARDRLVDRLKRAVA